MSGIKAKWQLTMIEAVYRLDKGEVDAMGIILADCLCHMCHPESLTLSVFTCGIGNEPN